MRLEQALGRVAISVLVLGICGAVSVSGAKKAKVQGIKLGSAIAHADRSEVDLNGKSILLSGGVSIETPDNQSISSDSMRLTMGTNPRTKKDDVAQAVAEGHVRFKTLQNVPGPAGLIMVRTIQGSSDRAVWSRFEDKADLSGHVTVSSDDAGMKMIWRDAGTANIDLKAGKIVANRAASGPQMTIEAISKTAPVAKKTTK